MSINVETLQRTIKKVKPETEEFAVKFYENLFLDYPQFQPLFSRIDMSEQRKHLVRALMLTVENFRDAETVKDALKPLGARHATYGATQNLYPLFCKTLLKTFESYLGEEWTPEVEAAWTNALDAIAQLMLEGAKEESA